MKTYYISFIVDGCLPILNVQVTANSFVEAIAQVRAEESHVSMILSCVSV
jgi:hypothetical protein